MRLRNCSLREGKLGGAKKDSVGKAFDSRRQFPNVAPAFGFGVVAQLVEHHNGIVGVRGSNPLGSTKSKARLTNRSAPRGDLHFEALHRLAVGQADLLAHVGRHVEAGDFAETDHIGVTS